MNAYLDASALVKIVAEEAGSEMAKEAWYAHPRRFTSRMTYAEVRAALARAARAPGATREDTRRLRERLEFRWSKLDVIEVSDLIVRLAGEVADRRGLRGYDAVHLASALLTPGRALMATWDRDLSTAASAEGLPTLAI